MSTPETPPTPDPAPTPAPAPNRDDTHDAAARAAEDAARRDNPSLTREQIKQIGEDAADAVIERLEARGVFDDPEPEPAPAAEPAPEQKPGEPAPDDAPAKKSFAARFMGH